MRFVWNTAEKDLRRHLRDPMTLLLYLGIPLLIGGLLTLVMGSTGNRPPTAVLLLADEDGGFLSQLLAGAFGQDRQGQFVRVERVTRDEGQSRIGRGDGAAMLVIPEGFGQAVLAETPTKLLLVVNPAQQILPQILQEGLEIAVEGTFYAHRLIGPELRELVQGPDDGATIFSNAEIARVSTSINDIVRRVSPYLIPPAIALESSIDERPEGPQVTMRMILLPGIVVMALMFMVQGLNADLWRERMQGTLRRAATTPRAIVVHLAGKVLAGVIVIGACAAVVLIIGMPYAGIGLGKLPVALSWIVASGAALLLVMMPVNLYSSTERAAGVMSNCLVMPLLFLGGSMFPMEALPDWMAAIGRWTPNGWVGEQLKNILLDPANAVTSIVSLVVLGVVGAVFFVINARRLRVFARN